MSLSPKRQVLRPYILRSYTPMSLSPKRQVLRSCILRSYTPMSLSPKRQVLRPYTHWLNAPPPCPAPCQDAQCTMSAHLGQLIEPDATSAARRGAWFEGVDYILALLKRVTRGLELTIQVGDRQGSFTACPLGGTTSRARCAVGGSSSQPP